MSLLQDDDDTLMPTAAVRKDFGDVSPMWIVRRLKDDSDFPAPLYIRGRRYWKRGELAEYKRLKAAGGAARSVARGVAAKAAAAL